ncbi:MAG: hypothetical protein ACE5JX_18520 [Acidobacteriota bacterium]
MITRFSFFVLLLPTGVTALVLAAGETNASRNEQRLSREESDQIASGQVGDNDFRITHMGPDGDPDFDGLRPAVAYNSFGEEFLVVWMGEESRPDQFEIYGQRVDATTGKEIGNRFQISRAEESQNLSAVRPDVARNSINDEYLVVWEQRDLDGTEAEIFGQRLDATGGAVGNNLQISEMGMDGEVSLRAFRPVVVYNTSENEYLVAWTGEVAVDKFEIHIQRIDATSGAEVGEIDSQLTHTGDPEDTDAFASRPDLAYNPTRNEYFIVWDADPTGEFEIFGLTLDGADSIALSPDPIRISHIGPEGDPNFYGAFSAVAYNPLQDEYLVVFEGVADADIFTGNLKVEIFSTRIDGSTGTPVGLDALQISNTGPEQDVLFDAFDADVAFNSLQNEYLVTWEADGVTPLLESLPTDDEFEIFAQRMDGRLGVEIGGNDFRISDMGPGPDGDPDFGAFFPALAHNDGFGNEYLVVWEGDDQTDGEFEIYGQRVSGLTPVFPDIFSPTISVTLEGTTGETVPGKSLRRILQTSRIFLDQDDLPGSRVLQADGGLANLESLSIGSEVVATEASLTAVLSGDRIEVASGQISYVVSELTSNHVKLLGVVTALDVNPLVLAMLPDDLKGIEHDAVGVAVSRAEITSRPDERGFIFSEEFQTASRVSEDYKGFMSELLLADTFSDTFYRTPRFSGALSFASDFTSRNQRLSAGTFSTEVDVQGQLPATFTADPNPIQVCEGPVGKTTIIWDAPGVQKVEVRVGSPDGTVFTRTGPKGSKETGQWVRNGMVFYLLDASDGFVLATVRVKFTRTGCPAPPVITATPNPIMVCDGGAGKTDISWMAEGFSRVEIRVGSPDGTLFARGGASGSKETGKWVRDGLTFFLLDRETGAVLDSIAVHLTSKGCPGSPTIIAEPNPIQVCDGNLGKTTLTWNAPGVDRVEVRIGTPEGSLFARTGSSGSKETGLWVRDGMAFLLLDPSSKSTLATVTVGLTSSGCPASQTGLRLRPRSSALTPLPSFRPPRQAWTAPFVKWVDSTQHGVRRMRTKSCACAGEQSTPIGSRNKPSLSKWCGSTPEPGSTLLAKSRIVGHQRLGRVIGI